MATPLNVAVVGLGFMGVTHLKAYQKVSGARIAALCNPSGRNLDGDFSTVFGNVGSNEPFKLSMQGIQAYRSYKELLANDEISIIDLCTPTLSHPEMVEEALAAGKQVICEKPLARTSDEARRIVKAASAAKTFFMPAMCLRFWPEFTWLKSAIEGGRYGKVLSATFRRITEPPGWSQNVFLDGKKSGGALLDLHIHDVDFAAYCFGKPKSVFASGYSKLSGAIDHVIAQYEVASGAVVAAEGSWAMATGFGFCMSYAVNFERVTVDFDSSRGAQSLKVFEPGQAVQYLDLKQSDGYVQELNYFVDCVTQNRPPKTVTAQDGLISVEICEAEERSIQTKKPVEL
jgi:predicted dehydrogenase